MEAKQPLLDKKMLTKSYLTPEMTPIHRYNIVIECYNMPCNIVNSITLEKIPQSGTYDFLFKISTHLRGKIAFIILCILPFINTVPLVFTCFFACVYRASLITHEKNTEKNKDPFRNMTFDPEVCFNMGCDYYFLTIELKQLEGILINYQQNMSDKLKLRKQRGKTNIMIYNANFWASYSYFEKWKVYHYSPFAFSLIMFLIANTICIVLIVT